MDDINTLDSKVIKNTKPGSLKRQYLLTKNIYERGYMTLDDYRFISDTMRKLINNLDELILFEIDDK